ncbi:MAG TPA: GMC family oxidoreductase N-terminal domain-containing protein [Actinomycetota bacterium]|nr:GMC family oxidoreductase N-terminal domain-containing protein [Actinomycetota bacterium]
MPRDVSPVLAALARGVLADAYEPDVPGRMLESIGRVATARDRDQLIGVLRALNTRMGAVALAGTPVPAAWLSPGEAEAVLARWRLSKLPFLRRLSGLLTTLALLSLYGFPGKHWERIGYPGPLGQPPRTSKRLKPLSLDGDEHIKCDAVVVGSGAGGGCVAAGLAAAGLDVVVVEKGGYNSESDFTHYESDAFQRMYLYGSTLATTDLGVLIIAGSTLGGGTVVNYTTSFRTPGHVLDEWARLTDIDAFVSGEFEESLDEVSERLGVNSDSSAAGKRDALMEEGLKKLGWHVDQMPRAVRGCTQDEQCGYCGFGCRVGAKQSTMRTYLQDAQQNGARLITDVDVRKVIVKDGRATGVEGIAGPHRLTVKARAVVVAGGAIETPALLLRSGLGGQVGHNLRLHPAQAAWGLFEEDVRAWEGTTQARYSNEFAHWDGGYGPIFETVPIHPGTGAAALPWLSSADHRARMDKFANISFVGALPRDSGAGRVSIGKDGSPRVFYKLSEDDERRLVEGIIAAGQVVEAAGAAEIYSPHAEPLVYRPSGNGSHERWSEDFRRLGLGDGRVRFFSYHQMGSCRMGRDRTMSVVDGHNESHEVKRLFVADASTFPTASGVNPMLTVYAIANRAAKGIAARLS